jgi:hypothetical protein
MNVPAIYEKEQDRENQSLVAKSFEKKWGYVFVESAPLCHWDFDAYFNNKLRALVEIKCRTISIEKFDTYIISQSKMKNVYTASVDLGVKTILIVRWIDMVGWLLYVEPNSYEIMRGGRYDRNDLRDIESVIHIPIQDFQLIEVKGHRDYINKRIDAAKPMIQF